jgi:probable rRNA maturation factor
MNTLNQAKALLAKPLMEGMRRNCWRQPSAIAKSVMGSSPARVSVRNLQRTIPVNAADLQIFAGKAFRCCLQLRKRKSTDLSQLHEVFVWLLSDRRMEQLHRKFLHQTGSTDVLTFQHGEIFISVETAKRQARVFENSLARELRLYLVHGLLHLHGLNDQTPADARKMKTLQEKILSVCSQN